MMAAKRRPGTELNHDNWNEEEEPEEKGEFRVASNDELSRRVIKTARRRNAAAAETPAVAATSVFGGFSGFTSQATAAPTSNSKAPASIFAFLSQDKKAPDNGAAGGGANDYHQKLAALNKSLRDWVHKHIEENPVCNLTPIFQDYEKHLKDIQPRPPPPPAATNGQEAKASSSFSSGSAATATALFGGASAPKPSAAKIAFGETSTSSSLFNSTPLVASASTGFSFGSAKPFSFGSTGPVAAEAPQKEADAEPEDDEDAPPKVEFKPVVEEDSVYSKRCKVFFKVEGNFQERGIGTIFVKPVRDSAKHQMIVRADTSLGNILVNVVLVKGLPLKKMGNNNVMLVCIPNTDFEKPVSVLFKVKAASDADEVIEKLTGFCTE